MQKKREENIMLIAQAIKGRTEQEASEDKMFVHMMLASYEAGKLDGMAEAAAAV